MRDLHNIQEENTLEYVARNIQESMQPWKIDRWIFNQT